MGDRVPFRITALLAVLLFALACEELKEPVPTAPGPVPPPAFSRYQIVGHWEATTDQSRRIAFDVTPDGRVINGRINVHHDCNNGRWRVTFDGFAADVVDDGFLTTFHWRNTENDIVRSGTMTVSGRFEADREMRGGFINSVNDVRSHEEPTGEVCPAIDGTYVGERP
jgi:hypothetical protein